LFLIVSSVTVPHQLCPSLLQTSSAVEIASSGKTIVQRLSPAVWMRVMWQAEAVANCLSADCSAVHVLSRYSLPMHILKGHLLPCSLLKHREWISLIMAILKALH
jgi:hypothetical protein